MINETFDAKTLILVFENGVNAKGDPAYVKKSFTSLTQAAAKEAIHDTGSKLAALFSLNLAKVCVDEDSILSD